MYTRAFDKMLEVRKQRGKATQHANGLEVYHWWMQDGVLPGQLSFDGEDWWRAMIEKELKIREVSGDYALDIPFADGSVNTIYFNSKQNAETVKHIIEVDGSKPNEATVCDM